MCSTRSFSISSGRSHERPSDFLPSCARLLVPCMWRCRVAFGTQKNFAALFRPRVLSLTASIAFCIFSSLHCPRIPADLRSSLVVGLGLDEAFRPRLRLLLAAGSPLVFVDFFKHLDLVTMV